MKHQMDLDERYAWQRKGKKYRTKYLAALGQLFGDSGHDKECQVESHTKRGSGTDQTRHLVDETGN